MAVAYHLLVTVFQSLTVAQTVPQGLQLLLIPKLALVFLLLARVVANFNCRTLEDVLVASKRRHTTKVRVAGSYNNG